MALNQKTSTYLITHSACVIVSLRGRCIGGRYMTSDLPTRSESISCARNKKTHNLPPLFTLEFKVFNYQAQTDYPTVR